jgi:hypothetical protein
MRRLPTSTAAEVTGMSQAYFYTLIPNKGGRLELVAIAIPDDGDYESPEAVWHSSRTADGHWTNPAESLGKPQWLAPRRLPTAAANTDGRLEIVVVGTDLWHTWQRRGGAWAGWHSLEKPQAQGFIGSSRLARNEDGRLELFTKMTDGTMWHRWQPKRGEGPWRKWHSLGTPGEHTFATFDIPPTVASNIDGRLELFVQADDGSVWHRRQTVPNGGWSDWSSLEAPGPSSPGEPVVTRNKDGRLELFMAVTDGNTWHSRQAEPGAPQWEAWSALGGPDNIESHQIAAGVHADGRLVLFVIGRAEEGDHVVWRLQQTAADDRWSEWKPIGRPAKDLPSTVWKSLPYIWFPTLVADNQGRLLLFSLAPVAVGAEATFFYVLEQATPSGDEWTPLVKTLYAPPSYIPHPAGEHHSDRPSAKT